MTRNQTLKVKMLTQRRCPVKIAVSFESWTCVFMLIHSCIKTNQTNSSGGLKRRKNNLHRTVLYYLFSKSKRINLLIWSKTNFQNLGCGSVVKSRTTKWIKGVFLYSACMRRLRLYFTYRLRLLFFFYMRMHSNEMGTCLWLVLTCMFEFLRLLGYVVNVWQTLTTFLENFEKKSK